MHASRPSEILVDRFFDEDLRLRIVDTTSLNRSSFFSDSSFSPGSVRVLKSPSNAPGRENKYIQASASIAANS